MVGGNTYDWFLCTKQLLSIYSCIPTGTAPRLCWICSLILRQIVPPLSILEHFLSPPSNLPYLVPPSPSRTIPRSSSSRHRRQRISSSTILHSKPLPLRPLLCTSSSRCQGVIRIIHLLLKSKFPWHLSFLLVGALVKG